MAGTAQIHTDIVVGEDLYGVSVHELESRIVILKSEISRIEAELTKKRTERSEAEHLFGTKP